MTRIVLVASFILVAFGAIESAFACSVPFFRALYNQTSDGHMTARSGRPCSIRLMTSSGPATSARIVQRPANGTVTIGSDYRIIYRSRPGFVGSDTFSYARHGYDRYNSAVTSTIRVAVRVTP